MYEIELSTEDAARCRAVAAELVSDSSSVEDEALIRQAVTSSQELPRSLRAPLNRFRLQEPSGACLVSGFPVDDERIGDTPPYWGAQSRPSRTLVEEAFFLMCASLLGEPFGWATQQGMAVMHDIVPIKGHEDMQLNSASASRIWWHVEDAFHPYRAEYVGMMCLRNPDRVATTYGSLEGAELPPDAVKVLMEPRFPIRPDESHRIDIEDDLDGAAAAMRRSYAWIEQRHREPERIAVLFGDPASPYLRLDPFFMEPTEDDPEATAALRVLTEALDRRLTRVALAPGEVLFVDNYRAVHGRESFRARYDGRDRWLKRLNVTRDLRKSRDARLAADARVVF